MGMKREITWGKMKNIVRGGKRGRATDNISRRSNLADALWEVGNKRAEGGRGRWRDVLGVVISLK